METAIIEDIRLLRLMVRGAYDLQALRMQMGLRLCANFRARLKEKIEEDMEGADDEPDLSEEALKVIDELKSSYRRLTDGVAKNRTLPDEKGFTGDALISSYTELVLVGQYVDLESQEQRQFRQMTKSLEKIPIYNTFLKQEHGIGPALAAVLITYFDPRKAHHISGFWKYCFPMGTLISTPNGMKAIDTLKVGDDVVDDSGKLTVIKETMIRKFSGSLVTLGLTGTLPLIATDEHPIKVYRDGMPSWLAAKDVKIGDKLIVPELAFKSEPVLQFEKLQGKGSGKQLFDHIKLLPDVAYVLGRFIGDGSTSLWQEAIYQRGRIQVVFGEHEIEEAEEYAENVRAAFGAATFQKVETGYRVSFGRKVVARAFVEWFGQGAHNKRIPASIMGCTNPETIRAFLRGYFDADGHVVSGGKSQGSILASSASEGLMLQLQLLLTRVGEFGSLHKQKREDGGGEIRGRHFNQKPWRFCLSLPMSSFQKVYDLDQPKEINRSARKVERINGGWLVTVKQALSQQVMNIDVFNLRTVSNTYLAQNIAVHNCGLDVAGDGLARSRRKEHLIDREYTTRDGKKATRLSTTYNPWLRMKLLGGLAPSFLRSASPRRELYDNYRNRILTDPARIKIKVTEWKKAYAADEDVRNLWPPARIHRAAMRYMIKIFLADFWLAWRKLEGLPVTPTYEEARRGRLHGEAAE